MEYITVGEAARRWGVTERRVQTYCAEGRVPGAERFGRAWRIPAGSVKPDDPRRLRRNPRNDVAPSLPRGGCGALMPLMGSPFLPGHAREYAASLDPGPRRDVALSELAYFTGDAAEAARLARPLLQATDGAARLSACLIFSYASLALGRINDARATLARVRGALDEKTVGGGVASCARRRRGVRGADGERAPAPARA